MPGPPTFPTKSDDDQRLVAIGQLFAAVRPRNDNVLNPRGKLVVDNNARLNSERHTFFERCAIAFGQEWRLVYVHADAVSEPVPERRAISRVHDHGACCAIYILAGGRSSLQCLDTRPL